ncbi:iron-sulfur cluster biosynthesis family protein [Bacillus sp. 165]|uniref:iron-sulfur cluster biosynthesis family protein n=1 Tax=Bacillus sp. 165 TaxID=1529117 RepID=UPI001ADA75BF|nr:iron-sulfur cluster biosynthesis family protein [Bacillus sp. 165]MBO9129208.1 Fe-S cluster assembly protein HesB [Bacillus sp. 165]
MELSVTEHAEQEMRRIHANPLIIRIHAEQSSGTCSLFVEFALIVDELKHEDVVYEKDGLFIQMNAFAKEYIGNKLKIDYNNGFRLISPNETLGYGMSIQKKG